MSRLRKVARTCGRSLALASLIVATIVVVAQPAAAARKCEGLGATLVGTRHDDVLRGTPSDDVIVGLGGDDEINGRGGDDVICGGDGEDSVLGGAGVDTLSGGEANDSIDGGDGIDQTSYAGAPTGVKLDLGAGTATGWGKDALSRIEQGVGSQHDDTLAAGRGAPAVTFWGGDGDDDLIGGRNDDVLDGGAGDDSFEGGGGRSDVVTYADSPNGVSVDLGVGTASGWGADTLADVQVIVGSAFDDVLVGGSERTTFVPGAGNDSVVGGTNGDAVDFSASAAAVAVDLGAGTSRGQGDDTLRSISSVVGSSFGDQIVGDASRNTLAGGAGDDSLAGRDAGDTLDGGEGMDALDGGPGNDSCSNGETLTNCEA